MSQVAERLIFQASADPHTIIPVFVKIVVAPRSLRTSETVG
jgi:hypothetical protein